MVVYSIYGEGYDSNIYILPGSKPTLIDTGTGLHSKTVLQKIQKHIDLEDIEQIVLTHEHFDHVGGVPSIIQSVRKKIRIYAHQQAVSKLQSGRSDFAELLGGVMPTIDVDYMLQGGEQIVLGDETYHVFSTPGHSFGGICLYGTKSTILFSGDIVFAHGGFGRYDFPGGDREKLLVSLKTLCSLDISSLYPGHGEWIVSKGSQHVQQALMCLSSCWDYD